MTSDLVERVARAINATCYDGCDPGEDHVRACVDPPCPCRAAARAAITVARREALEEAARTIECGCPDRDKVALLPPNGGERWRLCGEANCMAIEAAAIRALMEVK
jgi:hypothetical protein